MEGIRSVQIPVELWQTIFAKLTFDDQLNCRLVSKYWSDLIATLPEFTSKNILNLQEYLQCETKASPSAAPLALLQKSNLKFCGVSFSKRTIEYSTPVQIFSWEGLYPSDYISYLDLDGWSVLGDNKKLIFYKQYRQIVRNLCDYSSLHHLNVGRIEPWLYYSFPCEADPDLALNLIKQIIEKHGTNEITEESISSIVDSSTFEDVGKWVVEKYSVFVTEALIYHMEALNTTKRKNHVNRIISKMVDFVTSYFCKLEEKFDYVLKPCNSNVRVLTLTQNHIEAVDVHKIFQLLPNLQEIHLVPNESKPTAVALKLLELHPNKILTVTINGEYGLRQIQSFNLPNLKNLIVQSDVGVRMTNDKTKDLIEKCPNLKSVNLTAKFWPRSGFQYFTELNILSVYDYTSYAEELPNVGLFTNLTCLNILVVSANEGFCLIQHGSFSLESLTKLGLATSGGGSCCSECFKTLLQSLPNLKHLSYYNDLDNRHIESIFELQPDLVTLGITGPNKLTLNPNWPVMKNLRQLEMNFPAFEGSKRDWNRFGKKLKNVKCLVITNEDVLDLKVVLGNNFPLLKKLLLNHDDSTPRPIIRNGREVIVQRYPNQD